MKSNENFAHWYRRAIHAFGAVFLVYYLIPSEGLLNTIKITATLSIITIFGIIEIMRIKKIINLFGSRVYENERVASYFYFGIGVTILLIFFPQQIAVPSILCAAFADPAVGELRVKIGKKNAYLFMFLLSFVLFFIIWNNAPSPFFIIVPFLGAIGVLAGEIGNFRWIDDDLLIQIVPAVLISVLYLAASLNGIALLPNPIIHPLGG